MNGLVKVIEISQMLFKHDHNPVQFRFVEPPFASKVILIGFPPHGEQGGAFSKNLTSNETSQVKLLTTVILQFCAFKTAVLNTNKQTTASFSIVLIFARFFILVWFLVSTNLLY